MKTIFKFLKILMWLSVLGGLSVCGYYIWAIYEDNYGSAKFDKEKWINSPCAGSRDKVGMYEDLAKNYLKRDMSKSKVEGFLGAPNKGVFYCLDKKIKCVSYLMGSKIWSGESYLRVCYDKDEKVYDFGKNNFFGKVCKYGVICSSEVEKCQCPDGICEVEKW